MGLDPVRSTGEFDLISSREMASPLQPTAVSTPTAEITDPSADRAPSPKTSAPSDSNQPARSTTAKHKRVVTKKSEDGSYEIVYEEVDENQAILDFAVPAPEPLWKKKGLLFGVLALVGILVLFIVIGGAVLLLRDGGDSSATDASAIPSGRSTRSQGKKGYKYVAPKTNAERVNLDEEDDPTDTKGAGKSNAANRRGPGKVPAPSRPVARDVPNATPPPRPVVGALPLGPRGPAALTKPTAKEDEEGEEADDDDEASDDEADEDDDGEAEEEGGDDDEGADDEGADEEADDKQPNKDDGASDDEGAGTEEGSGDERDEGN